jgi:hypothetical protein
MNRLDRDIFRLVFLFCVIVIIIRIRIVSTIIFFTILIIQCIALIVHILIFICITVIIRIICINYFILELYLSQGLLKQRLKIFIPYFDSLILG